MLGEKLELHDIPFLFQEHTSMSKVIEPSNVLPLPQVVEAEVGKDLLTEILRKGARELLARAVEQEVQEWLSERSGLMDERGRKLVVRNGHLPARTILTGIGPVAVCRPRVRVNVKCCGRGGESGGDFGEDDAVLELGVFGDFDEVHCGVEGSPVVTGGLGELEEHRQRGLACAVAFGTAVTQADGREGGFDRVRGS